MKTIELTNESYFDLCSIIDNWRNQGYKSLNNLERQIEDNPMDEYLQGEEIKKGIKEAVDGLKKLDRIILELKAEKIDETKNST